MSIEISHISKKFGAFTALEDINLTIPSGEITALLGPSGSGKTTLLRIIAGLEMPDLGSISLFGEDSTFKQTRDRKVGFVFQHYALFKHMSVFENIAFGLRIRPRKFRPSKEEIREKVLKLLSLVQLESLANRLPNELSGGQKQRVALARALAIEPRVLLLDEPFGALDAKVRQELRRWLRFLHDEIHITSVFVTHDQEEALEVSDNIVILNKGKVEQVGSPEDVYDRPANPFVYGFLGNVNLFHARLDKGVLNLEGNGALQEEVSPEVSFFVRPQDVSISLSNSDGKGIEARITDHRVLGGRVRVNLKTFTGGKEIEADIEKKQWSLIAKENRETVFLFFSGAKIYTKDETWSDYAI
ncbi:sulfate/molybdate ABC transporter ATP-binding protein [Leadbettera azotonutricia]|uniref:Sulfate/thiosulfate import ATP-binding protein CysA n=1 Tax=Leadbettera azotonutricia (strain ATCC BAA-888 / DSM 13862 / ZAS-9) TaxID=545695 RepID=F5YCL9_LEAAZ|nr:sulfate ABC transporter ATP-binding protein [Leadbettera azotonutricia]AEF81035.1 sulfate/thiosulfate import ATP-binding protein CysA [Leadbettera azotonutricia ZAS-9]